MVERVNFLRNQDVYNLRKNRCVFSGHEFETKVQSSGINERWVGSSYYERQIDVSTTVHLISDLDLYLFEFKLSTDAEKELNKRKREVVDYLTAHKEAKAKARRGDLEFQFGQMERVDESDRQLAVDAIINKDLSDTRGYYLGKDQSRLSQNVDELFHLLCLDDLQAIAHNSADPENQQTNQTYFNPMGLKAQVDRWPFEHFDKDLEFTTKFENLYAPIMRTQIFTGYDRKFEDFEDQKRFVQGLDVEITAKKYKPTDHI